MLDVYKIAMVRVDQSYLFVLNVLFGLLHRKIENPQIRKWTTTLFGLTQIVLIFKYQIWHLLVCIFINAFLASSLNQRICHTIVTTITLLYISLFRLFYYDECKFIYHPLMMVHTAYSANIIGLVFDKHFSLGKNEKEQSDYVTNPKFTDILHYSFCHVNITSVGFYRYRTYSDFIDGRFAINSHCFKYIFIRIVKIIIYGEIYGHGPGRLWPIGYIVTQEFQSSNIWYKMCYSSLHMVAYYLWMYVAFLSSETVSASAGFGAYPVQGENKCGHGPTKDYKALMNISREQCKNQTYDYNTIICTDSEKNFTTPWSMEFIRTWNSTYQYWLTTIIYRNISLNMKAKEKAMFITFLFSAVWHGISPGFYVTSILFPAYTVSMKYYWNISKHLTGLKSDLFLLAVWCMRMFFFGYIGIPFLLFNFNYILHYYNSVYYLPFALHGVVHALGVYGLTHVRQNREEFLKTN